LAVPGSFNWFFALGFLGYRTKLSLIVLVAFIVGDSVTTFLRGSIGAMDGIGRFRESATLFSTTILLDRSLERPQMAHGYYEASGNSRPQDTTPKLPDILETRRKMVELLPSNEQPRGLYELNSEKLAADMADLQWERWYDHYHTIVLRPDDRDSFFHVGYNLRINFGSGCGVCVGQRLVRTASSSLVGLS
jgi:hypothetical protein